MAITGYNITYCDDVNTADSNGKTPLDKNYMRILFKPGYAVQTRELNQLQSLIQAQLDRVGESIFRSGKPVLDGLARFDNTQEIYSINVISGSAISEDYDFLSRTAGSGSSGGELSLQANVVSIVPNGGTNKYKLYVKGVNSETVLDANGVSQVNSVRYSAGDTLSIYNKTDNTVNDITLTVESVNTSVGAHISKGVYFVKGCYAIVDEQYTAIDIAAGAKFTGYVALQITEGIADVNSDSSLLDNARGSGNYSSPGADRYFINLELKIVNDNSTEPLDTTNYITLLKVVDDKVVLDSSSVTFSGLDDKLAERTFEESGNYEVNPFPIHIREAFNDLTNGGLYTQSELEDHGYASVEDASNDLIVTLDPSVAYVKGYRVQLKNSIPLKLKKARTTATQTNAAVSADMGMYVDGTFESGSDIPNIENVSVVYNLINGSTQIGTAKIRSIESNGGDSYRLFLYDIQLSSGTDTIEIGTKIRNQSASIKFITTTVLKNSDIKTALYELPISPIKNIGNVQITKKKVFTNVSVATAAANPQTSPPSSVGTLSVVLTDTENAFDKSPNNIIIRVSGTVSGSTVTAIVSDIDINQSASNTLSLTLNGLPSGITSVTALIIASVVTTPKRGDKKLKTATQTISAPVNGEKTLSGIYHLVSVSGPVGTTCSIVNDGQHDSHYESAKVNIIKSGTDNTNISITVTYYDFETSDAVYYDALSYKKDIVVDSIVSTVQIPLEDLPTYGDVQLSNVLDFRYCYGASIFSPIDPYSPITFDAEYYIPRIDSVVVNQSGSFSIISGTPSITPKKPSIPDTSMELYTLGLSGYTFNSNDVTVDKIDNKRYTMSNIRALDRRISNLEYYTTLSFLEKNAKDMTILDTDGTDRFKNGFVVDNFVGHNVSDPTSGNSVCSIDPETNECRPAFSIQSLKLEGLNTSQLSPGGEYISGVHNRAVTLPYTTLPYISQTFGSEHESVNPFNVATFVGKLNLYPSSDYWCDTSVRPDVVIKNDTLKDGFQNSPSDLRTTLGIQFLGFEWKSWETYWSGPLKNKLGSKFYRSAGTHGAGKIRPAFKYNLAQDIKDIRDNINNSTGTSNVDIGERTVDITVRPYIRQRYVYFEARSLKPNTIYYPFFDGVNVGEYCYLKDANSIDRKSNISSINGVPLVPLAHDPNDTLLKTDSNGTLYGLFIIPNSETSGLKFLTGTREFKLTDSPKNLDASATSYASADYVASGSVKTTDSTIVSTAAPETVRSGVQDISNNSSRLKRKTSWFDPIAQSFIVNNPEGIFATGVDLYFAKKSSTGATVEVFIVTCENGIPTQKVVPLSTVVKIAEDVNVNSNGSTATYFEFEQPIYLSPGQEYAIVCVSADSDYRVYTATLGSSDVITNQIISTNPYNGVFFKSQNSSTWTPDQSKDLKFRLHRAKFTAGTEKNVTFNTPSLRTIEKISITNAGAGYTSAPTVTFSGGNPTRAATAIAVISSNSVVNVYLTDPGAGYVSLPTIQISAPTGSGSVQATAVAVMSNFQVSNFILNQDAVELSISDTAECHVKNSITVLNSSYEVSPNVTYVSSGTKQSYGDAAAVNRNNLVELNTTLYSSSDYLSPVVDTERLNVKLIQNNLRTDTATTSRYVTRTINLAQAADQIDIYFDINRPSVSCNANVYVKYDSDLTWTAVSLKTLNSIPVNSDEYTFDEVQYTALAAKPFSSFRVKIEFIGSNIVDAPRIKNFRAIATT